MNDLLKLSSTGLDYTNAEVLKTIKDTIAPDSTDSEFKMFIEYCKGTGLNPHKKEVWFIKTKPYTKKDGTKVEGKVQIMTGINGFYAIANNQPQYDGMEEVVIETNDKGNIIKAIAKVHRKDRKFPSVGVAEWAEYAPEKTQFNGGSIWFSKPRLMLSKVAESIALRKAFPNKLNGLYTQEEMPHEFNKESFTDDGQKIEYRTKKPKEVVNVTPVETPTKPFIGDPWTYLLESPNSKNSGKMLCELDPDWFGQVVNNPKYWGQISEKDRPAVLAAYEEVNQTLSKE